MRRILAVLACLCVPASAAAAQWREVAHPYDVKRIETLSNAVSQGNAEAEGFGSGYDQAVVTQLMNAPAGPFDEAMAVGDWRCRTIKVGGNFVQIVLYGWFDCRILREGSALMVEKRTGSQNFKGRLYADGPNRQILLAGGFYGYEPQRAYQAQDSTDGKSSDNRDKVAVAEMLGPDWLRFTFPWPARESTYDIIEFRRDG